MADTETPYFRNLYRDLLSYQGRAAMEDILVPWLPKAHRILGTLQAYRRLDTPENPYEVKHEDHWQWYALGRINDFLLLSVQARDDFYRPPSGQGEPWREWMPGLISPADYLDFFRTLDFQPFTLLPYSPLHFEIVEVLEAPDAGSEAVVDHVFWPGLQFGEMLFSRAGARVRAPRRLLDKTVAETSRLYFTHRRLWHRATDLSVGWGSNSQWATAFRRDYDCGGRFYHNADERQTARRIMQDDLTPEERVELLTNRCFVNCKKDDSDLFPYNDFYSTPHIP